ncbi:Amino acid/polyamine transporter I [Penicillium roqueforti FM164]|uniref:Amino acid/polyamine transporter I n=1 Tax=Penicillium roqueforti (strain FM164) TaxID=1365484 RepID=W6Q099_PENRF|nr:Amino acid/polyamine transporter I [Penicillium roqueforti FM164]
MTVAILLSLINISSDTTIEDIVSIVVSGIYPSYLIVSIFLFYRRVRGDISRYNDNEDDIINSIVAIGGSVFLAIIYYVVRARHIYKGPIVEVSL